MITNDTGAVVYSTAHGPYGAIEKTWTNSYDPALKFSGKEREKGSGLDYFGARYYGHTTYRWLSPDPVRARDAALSNPQLWNLYAYCRNSPITYWDPDGMLETSLTKHDPTRNRSLATFAVMKLVGGEKIDDFVSVDKSNGKYEARFKYRVEIWINVNPPNEAKKLEHEKHHAEGFEWLYNRNVEMLKKAEEMQFTSSAEAMEFGKRLFQQTVEWKPFKWRLHNPQSLAGFNVIGWLTHNWMWNRWSRSQKWH